MQTIKNLIPLGINLGSRVLVCMPHPDDEAVFVAGTISKLTSLKIETKVLTFSRGEKSTLRYGLDSRDDLGKVRTLELIKSINILGVNNFKILDFGDGQLENQEKKITSYLNKELKEYKPTHIITLEPNGIYGHPDHMALSKYVAKIADKSVKILYVTVNPNYTLPVSAAKMAKISVRPTKPEYELRLTWKESFCKLLALRSHKSQFIFDVFHPNTFISFLKNKMLRNEYFVKK